MNRFIFFTFFFMVNSINTLFAFQTVSVYADSEVSAPKAFYKENDPSLIKHKEVYGVSFSSKYFDFRFLKKDTDITGFSIHASKPDQGFSLKMRAGNLLYSKAVSKLKNPSYYTETSPLYTPCIFTGGISISLPSKSSSSKVLSSGFSLLSPVISLQFAMTEDQSIYLCASKKFENSDFVKCSLLLAYSSFMIDEKKQDSWKLSEPFYASSSYNAAYAEFLLKIPLVKAKLGFSTYENPFNTVRFCSLAEAQFRYGAFSLGLGAFMTENCPMPVITASQKREKKLFQAMINPQIEYSSRDFYFKGGISSFVEESIVKEGKDSESDWKVSLSAGAYAKFDKNSLSFLYKIQNITKPETKQSASVKFSHSSKKAKLSLQSKLAYTKTGERIKDAFSHTWAFFCYPKDFPVNYFSFSSSFEHKNSTLTPSLAMTASISRNIKNVKISSKIKVSTVLEVE